MTLCKIGFLIDHWNCPTILFCESFQFWINKNSVQSVHAITKSQTDGRSLFPQKAFYFVLCKECLNTVMQLESNLCIKLKCFCRECRDEKTA
jgi:hypothetical protein